MPAGYLLRIDGSSSWQQRSRIPKIVLHCYYNIASRCYTSRRCCDGDAAILSLRRFEFASSHFSRGCYAQTHTHTYAHALSRSFRPSFRGRSRFYAHRIHASHRRRDINSAVVSRSRLLPRLLFAVVHDDSGNGLRSADLRIPVRRIREDRKGNFIGATLYPPLHTTRDVYSRLNNLPHDYLATRIDGQALISV